MTIRAQRLADIAVQRVDDDFLTALAKARVPRCSFVEEGTPIHVTFNVLARAFCDVGNALATNVFISASTILQIFPNVQEELIQSS
jgi:hypothetical protein